MSMRFSVGLDLGQITDFTAIAVAERVKEEGQPAYDYHLRHLQRFKLGTSYPDIVADVKTLLEMPQLKGQAMLSFDCTGVGVAVADLLDSARLPCPVYPVTITGGDVESRDGGRWKVPKRDLIAVAQVFLQTQRLKIAQALPESATLIQELLDYRVRIDSTTIHDSYDARSGSHDDLVLAVTLALWVAERFGGELVLPFVLRRRR